MASRISVAEVKKVKLLLFSEDPLESRWLKQLLGSLRSSRNGRHGLYYVSCTDRISAALQSLRQHHFDAVLLDLGMATQNDLDPLRQITAAAPHLPVVAISGFNDESLV
ncbi:MAG: response regulator, partial [Thermoguttaceae bacterium]